MVAALRDGSLPPPNFQSVLMEALEANRKRLVVSERLVQELAQMTEMVASLLSRDADMRSAQESRP
jgi:hypothetical protein